MVVESQFDSVTSVLEQYRVHYTILSAADLQQGEWIESCDLLFIPCGYGPGIEQQMQILVAGTDLRGVALSPDYRHIDEKKIRDALRLFVKKGGAVYFDDFAVTTLAKAWPGISFYRDFAHLGLPGTISAETRDHAAAFGCPVAQRFVFRHSGWVVVEEADGFSSWFTGRVPTAIGDRPAVLAGWRDQGKGALYFSVFHQPEGRALPVRFAMMQALHRGG
jgi:hypothetical protein